MPSMALTLGAMSTHGSATYSDFAFGHTTFLIAVMGNKREELELPHPLACFLTTFVTQQYLYTLVGPFKG